MIKKVKHLFCAGCILIVAVCTSGCDKSSPTLKEDLIETFCSLPWVCSNKNRVVLDLATYNYTDHEIGADAVQAPEKNDIKSAIAGAVVWDKKQKPPVSIKVWWEVIYDQEANRKDKTYDSSKEKRSASGTVWCEAIVKIKEPYPSNPRQLNVHFFPDGHVEADVGESSDPIVSEEQKLKLPRLPAGHYCEKTIDNPWFGVDTRSHWQ